MRKIPFTKAVIVSGEEVDTIIGKMSEAVKALDESATLNTWLRALLVRQSEHAELVMQINLLLAAAMGEIRRGEDVEMVVASLEVKLQEFSA